MMNTTEQLEAKLAAVERALSSETARLMALRMREFGIHAWAECLEQYVKALDVK